MICSLKVLINIICTPWTFWIIIYRPSSLHNSIINPEITKMPFMLISSFALTLSPLSVQSLIELQLDLLTLDLIDVISSGCSSAVGITAKVMMVQQVSQHYMWCDLSLHLPFRITFSVISSPIAQYLVVLGWENRHLYC